MRDIDKLNKFLQGYALIPEEVIKQVFSNIINYSVIWGDRKELGSLYRLRWKIYQINAKKPAYGFGEAIDKLEVSEIKTIALHTITSTKYSIWIFTDKSSSELISAFALTKNMNDITTKDGLV